MEVNLGTVLVIGGCGVCLLKLVKEFYHYDEPIEFNNILIVK